jgi:hypothetical protein
MHVEDAINKYTEAIEDGHAINASDRRNDTVCRGSDIISFSLIALDSSSQSVLLISLHYRGSSHPPPNASIPPSSVPSPLPPPSTTPNCAELVLATTLTT